MKKLINEQFKRMQLLAGLITESQLNEAATAEDTIDKAASNLAIKKLNDMGVKIDNMKGAELMKKLDSSRYSEMFQIMASYFQDQDALEKVKASMVSDGYPVGGNVAGSQPTNELFGMGKSKSQFTPGQKVTYTASNGSTAYNKDYMVGKVFPNGEIGLYEPNDELKKMGITAKSTELKLAESTDIEKSVNEALRKFRRMLSENPVKMSMQEFMPKIDEITKKMNIHLIPQVLEYNDFISKMKSIKGDFSKAGVAGDKTAVIAATGPNGQADSLCCFSLSDDPTNPKDSFKLIDNFYEVVKKEFPTTTFKQYGSTPYDVTGEFAKLHGEKVVVGMAVITNFVKPAAAAPTSESTNIEKSVNEALRKYRNKK